METSNAAAGRYELRFQSLFREGRAWAFPCNAQGHVDLDALSERARDNYWFVRTTVGREVDVPRVRQLLS
ncbi:MAG TPA: hypothetical protein VIO33_10150 [Burkholderiaceae bacterium]